jgi:putative FmdB family regulatory protein
MPSYLYKCRLCAREQSVIHSMAYEIPPICDCGGKMHKVPQATRVNWGGLPPSGGDAKPLLQYLERTAPRRRELIQEHKEHA